MKKPFPFNRFEKARPHATQLKKPFSLNLFAKAVLIEPKLVI
jgi:hypothetical protein